MKTYKEIIDEMMASGTDQEYSLPKGTLMSEVADYLEEKYHMEYCYQDEYEYLTDQYVCHYDKVSFGLEIWCSKITIWLNDAD